MPELTRPQNSPATQKWTRFVILAVGSVTTLCFLALSPVLRRIIAQDRAAAPPRSGIGIVEQIVPPKIEENTKPIPTQVWLRVNGQIAPAETVFGSDQLHVGQKAQVVYRIGKSGRIYIDRVEPVPGHETVAHPTL